MDERICPVCKSVIELGTTRCQYCNADLTQFDKKSLQESGDQPGTSQRVVPQRPPEKQTAPLEGPQKDEPDEFVPDWLARIRAREAVEHAEKKAEEEKILSEKKSRSVIPDWLQSLNEDASVQSVTNEESADNFKNTSPVIIEPVPFESGIIESSKEGSRQGAVEPIASEKPEKKDDWLENLKPIETPFELVTPHNEEKSLDSILDYGTLEDSPLDLEKILNLGNDEIEQIEVPQVGMDEIPLGEFNPNTLLKGEGPVAEKTDNADQDFFKLVIPDNVELSSNESEGKQSSVSESKIGENVEEEDGLQNITFPFEVDSDAEEQFKDSVNRIETAKDFEVSQEDLPHASDEKNEIIHQGAGSSDLDFSSLFLAEQSIEPGHNTNKDDLQDLGEPAGIATPESSTEDYKFPFEEKPEEIPQMNILLKKIVTSELDFSDIISAADNPPLQKFNEEQLVSQDGEKAINELSEFSSQVPQEGELGDFGTENKLESGSLDLSDQEKPADKSESSLPFELNALDKQIFEDLGLQPVEKHLIEPIETKATDESYPWDRIDRQEILKDSPEPENSILEQAPQLGSLASDETVSTQKELDKPEIGFSVEENLFDLSELEKTLPFLDQSLSGESQYPEISDENQMVSSLSDSLGIQEDNAISVPSHGIDNLTETASNLEQLANNVDDRSSETGVQPSGVSIDPFKLDEISVAPFLPEELPEWLTDVKPAEQVSAPIKRSLKVPVEDDGSPNPEKANLPAWLAAMRPVESVGMAEIPESRTKPDEVLDQDGDVVTDFGEVAAAGIAAKPSDLAGGLKISSRQKTNAAILSLIAANAETIEETDKAVVGRFSPALWRTLLAILFIGFAILGGTYFAQSGLQPVLFPEQVVHTFDKINAIAPEKTVLLAGDFEAAFAGEIRLTSQAVIEHLMRRDMNIALLSINPVDSAILSGQITTGQVTVGSYQAGSKVVDLGYLPGGALAVQDLVTSFSGTVPLTANRDITSTQALLKSITVMKDFGAIIVLTDKAETARIWVEQLSDSLGDTPLLIISSAQAAPLIHPYYESGQVDGVVSGLANGLIYERILGSTGAASRNNSTLQILSVLMAGLILAGGFVSLVKPKMSKGKGK